MPVPASFLAAQDILAATLPGYTRRQHQIDLAEKITQALEARRVLLAQAGTGTGKSLALMISALTTGERTVVGVPTKTLQDQYIKDLTFLEANLGIEEEGWWAVLKGRANYPCWVRANKIESPTFTQRRVLEKMKLNANPETGQIIDRESFPQVTKEEWRAFSMSSDECPGKDCPLAAQCFAERAKAKAADARIVVTNFAYLLQDLQLRLKSDDTVTILGEYSQLLLDEAHMLPDAVTSALQDTVSEATFSVLARDLIAYLAEHDKDDELAAEIERAAGRLWDHLTGLWASFAKGNPDVSSPMILTHNQLMDIDGSPVLGDDGQPLLDAEGNPVMDGDALGRRIVDIVNAIDAARDEVKATRGYDEDDDLVRARLMRRTDNLARRLLDLCMDPPDQTVRWVEREEVKWRGEKSSRLVVRSSPVKIAPFLKATIWDKTPATILSSATLAAGSDFGPLMELLGLSRQAADTYDAGSPFDYPKQALLFYPDAEAPSPERGNEAAWRSYAQTVTGHLVEQSGGGALLLFTSRAAMESSYQSLSVRFQLAGLTVIKQDGDTPSSELIRVMKTDGNAVLFALRSFFEGVDIPGRALRLVVVDKLPFTPPSDPVYQARSEEANRRHGEFGWLNYLAKPLMILVLSQAFGRLIRHADDIGVVAILDSRLSSRKYGRQVVSALPPARRTNDIGVASAFLESLRQDA